MYLKNNLPKFVNLKELTLPFVSNRVGMMWNMQKSYLILSTGNNETLNPLLSNGITKSYFAIDKVRNVISYPKM